MSKYYLSTRGQERILDTFSTNADVATRYGHIALEKKEI